MCVSFHICLDVTGVTDIFWGFLHALKERFLVQGNDITGAVPNGMCQLDPSEMEADCDVQCACCTDACSRN